MGQSISRIILSTSPVLAGFPQRPLEVQVTYGVTSEQKPIKSDVYYPFVSHIKIGILFVLSVSIS